MLGTVTVSGRHLVRSEDPPRRAQERASKPTSAPGSSTGTPTRGRSPGTRPPTRSWTHWQSIYHEFQARDECRVIQRSPCRLPAYGWHDRPASRRMGSPADPPSAAPWRAIAMTGIEASTSPPALPRWFGPRASPDDPAVSALIDRVARGAGWADIGGGFNLNLRIDAEPPVVLRVHRPWVRRGRVAGLGLGACGNGSSGRKSASLGRFRFPATTS